MELKQSISLWSGVVLAVGMVIGSGLFGIPGMAIESVGESTAIVGWALVILLMVPMITVFVQLGTRYSTAAGLAKYAQIALGPWASSGVTAVLCGTFTIGIPALAMIGAAYTCKLFAIPEEQYMHIVAAGFLLLSTVINIRGIEIASIVNSISLYLILGIIILLLVLNIDYAIEGTKILAMEFSQPALWDLSNTWAVMALLFWAFLGWENMSFGLEEFKNPQKTIPAVYWLSFILVSVIYFSLALVASGAHKSGLNLYGVSGLEALANSNAIKLPFLIAVVFVILANANSWVFGASRLIYSAGKDGILPRFLGNLNSKSIPQNSLVALFSFYAIFILVSYLMKIPVAKIVLVVSQNFLVLYAFSILAYFKTMDLTISTIIIGALAALSCAFLLTGFTWWLFYPVFWLIIGYLAYKNINTKRSS